MLYWPLRHAPSAIFPVVHKCCGCFDRFVLQFSYPAVLHTGVVFEYALKRLVEAGCSYVLLNKNSTGGSSACSSGPGTYLNDQIPSIGFLQQPSFEDESSSLVLPSLLLLTRSCIHCVFCGSPSAKHRRSYPSLKTNSFQCYVVQKNLWQHSF